MGGWTFQGQPDTLGESTTTLVEGGSFCVCEENGDILTGGAQGLYYADTRLMSRWELRVDDAPMEIMKILPGAPYHATFLGRTPPRPGRADSTMLVVRDRYVGGGLREDVTLRNLADEAAGCVLTLLVATDLADLFEVKAHRIQHAPDIETVLDRTGLRIYSASRSRGSRLIAEHGEATFTTMPGMLSFETVVDAHAEWRVTLQINPILDGQEGTAWFSTLHPPERAEPAMRLAEWMRASPGISTTDAALAQTLRRSRIDLGSLRLFDPDRPGELPSIAAGAPWFMTLFGRDSLLTSWMALPLDQTMALGTLRRLAGLQGTKVNLLTEEEPGKILHELRFGVHPASPLFPGGQPYYGSVDSTPLFVMLLGELRRWGLADEDVRRLLPHADAALEWMEDYGSRNDGFLSYRRKTDRGLINQGWKDSHDGVTYADGSLAKAPIALAEAQGYAYAAYIARAQLAHELGDTHTWRRCEKRAAVLREAFNERFWLPDRGYYALGLDGEGRCIDSLASNMGHCLWTGIVEEDRASRVAEHLLSPQMFSGYGVRTLATDMGAYNPMSYHNGSVWPHDNALVAAGLMRYGFVAEAQRVAEGLLEAAQASGGRLPELFCGFDRGEFPAPIPYPTSCSPQAWAAASPIQLVRSLLRFDPWVPYGKLWIAPALPRGMGLLQISNLAVGGARLVVKVRDGDATAVVHGLPPGLEVINEPRPPGDLTAPEPGR
ncbi:glycogen debranching N-terminal domain-containing protein [Sphaerisporangium sp. TRM90804]|uniref:amylo-alpha-1,6-glucosidase n=1 Tax=Sphaerisporangium sp. TRM90804 TaxID=3031113 RepID=UPI0024497BE5|nr:glycogen debranching N-terminal domain-containing protein [Sphaerisporangium sp. TRM90804]MDH2427671.1 glycogen debranching N-terminal domain-containing protein [Sphaerisporangium sp. TRM90804]